MLVLTPLLALCALLSGVDATASPSTTLGSKTPTGSPTTSPGVSPTGNPGTTSSYVSPTSNPSTTSSSVLPTGNPSTTSSSAQPTYTVGAGGTRIHPISMARTIGDYRWSVAFGNAFVPGQEIILSHPSAPGFPRKWDKWTLEEGRTTISMRNEHFELCIDPGDAPTSGSGLTVQECDGSVRQVWHVEGRRIRWSCGDLCLDLPGGRLITQPLQLWACTRGSRNQQWSRSKAK